MIIHYILSMARTPSQNQALREMTRQRILAAGLKLFSRKGYGETSVQDLAREAGLSQGLLYRHFTNKAALLRALMQQSMDDVRLTFTAAKAETKGDPLRRLVTEAISLLQAHREAWQLSYAIRMQSAVLKTLARDFEGMREEIAVFLIQLFAQRGSTNPQVDAALFFAQLDGLCQHYAMDPKHYPLEVLAHAWLDKLDGLKKKDAKWKPEKAPKQSPPKPAKPTLKQKTPRTSKQP